VTLSGLFGFLFILIFLALILFFSATRRRRTGMNLRQIPAFTKLRRALGLAVEAGSRLHISIGRGSVIGEESASAFVGLSMLERLGRTTSMGDNPPVATAGDGALGVLAEDTLQATYNQIGLTDQYRPSTSQVVGLTPFSYAAGTLPIVSDPKTGANILAGNFGLEVALITDAGERSQNLTLAGTDSLPGQAVIYATAHEPLIGEEIYAGGAYLNAGATHTASLRAQDILRWFLVFLILVGILAKFLGLDTMVTDFLSGLL
jgi:hypothetical protein